jgi:CheY-like chemotaxis protein
MIQDKRTRNTTIEPSINWSNKTILVVEDEEINFFYIKEAVEGSNVNLIYANNGLAAIKICKEKPIDLILMDIKMPVMSGYEATEKTKQICPKVPVIAQTAYSLSGEKKKSIEAGCDGYLSKPISPDMLVNTISRFIDSD